MDILEFLFLRVPDLEYLDMKVTEEYIFNTEKNKHGEHSFGYCY